MTAGPMGWPEAAEPIPAERPVVVWDVVTTVVLLVGLTVLALFATLLGAFLGMVSDPCGGGVACDVGRIDTGVLVAMASPLVVLIAAVAYAAVRLVRRRRAFWVPLAGAGLLVAVWIVGAALAISGVPQ